MAKRVVRTDKVAPSKNPLSQAVVANRVVYVSGQVGRDAQGNMVSGLAGQTRQALENLKAILEAAGSSLDNVVSVLVFLRDINRIAEFNEVYRQYFPSVPQARAAVEVTRLGGTAEVEIVATALVPQ